MALYQSESSLPEYVITNRRKEEAAKLILLRNRVDATSTDSNSGEPWQQKSFQANTLMCTKNSNKQTTLKVQLMS